MAEETTTTATTETTETTPATEVNPTAEAQKAAESQKSTLTEEAIEKLVQSRVDKITANLGKEKAEMAKELEALKKDKMSAEEVAKYELEQEKKALADQKKELADKANRLTGINALTQVNLYDGSETATALLDMVVSGVNEDSDITNRVTAVKAIIDKLVAAQVQQTFKDNGRVANGGGSGADNDDGDKKNNIAAELGKKAAERAKNSNEILNYYYKK